MIELKYSHSHTNYGIMGDVAEGKEASFLLNSEAIIYCDVFAS